MDDNYVFLLKPNKNQLLAARVSRKIYESR